MSEQNEVKECCECCANDRPVTAALGVPNTWQNRMKDEYWTLKHRRDALHNMLIKLRAGTLDFKPNCDASLLSEQEKVMNAYLDILETRAEIEGVCL